MGIEVTDGPGSGGLSRSCNGHPVNDRVSVLHEDDGSGGAERALFPGSSLAVKVVPEGSGIRL
jgi:hypothetical protein